MRYKLARTSMSATRSRAAILQLGSLWLPAQQAGGAGRAHGGEEGVGAAAVLQRGVVAQHVRAGGLADEAGRVGHDAHDARALRQVGLQAGDAHAGRDADEQVPRLQVRRQRLQDAVQVLRLHLRRRFVVFGC